MMNKQTLNVFTRLRLGIAAFALVAFVLVGSAPVGLAQTGSGSPPPTYDYNDMLPGIQGPTSPLLADSDNRTQRVFQLQIPVLVPLAEFQALLPPGFNAVATPAGSSTVQVILGFYFQQRTTRTADNQTFGPSPGLLYTAMVMNTNIMPNRNEVAVLGSEFTNPELVDALNATFGSGNARLATKINVQIMEDGGTVSFKSNVTNDATGLNISAQATCPGPIVTRTRTDPTATPFRYFTIPQKSSFIATQSDTLAVPQAMANVKLETPDGKFPLSIAGGGSGSLTIVGLGANITFGRNAEVITKFQ